MKNKILKNRILKSVVTVSALCLAGMSVSGCGLVTMPELTEEQTELVTEYAAGLILKYDPLRPESELLDDEELKAQSEEEALKRQKERETKAAAEDYLKKKANAGKQNEEETNKDSEGRDDSNKSEPEEAAVGDLAQFYGMNDFSISYTGYELTDSYPTSGSDLLMAMDATEGKTLCVLKFAVTNNSASDTVFDMFYRNPNFYLSIDGGEKIHQQYTLLLDDMAASNDTIGAGDTVERVLIFEVPGDTSNIGSMSMQAKNGEGAKGTMILQ